MDRWIAGEEREKRNTLIIIIFLSFLDRHIFSDIATSFQVRLNGDYWDAFKPKINEYRKNKNKNKLIKKLISYCIYFLPENGVSF